MYGTVGLGPIYLSVQFYAQQQSLDYLPGNRMHLVSKFRTLDMAPFEDVGYVEYVAFCFCVTGIRMALRTVHMFESPDQPAVYGFRPCN
jgi:hypothetical protein